MTFKEIQAAKDYLDGEASYLDKDIDLVWQRLIADERFLNWSGCDHKDKHHYGWGGLIIHTAEVVKVGFAACKALDLKLDVREFFLAALFHDTGKMYDYKPIDTNGDYSEWTGTEHKRLIHHISRSALIWSQSINQHPTLSTKYHDNVLHAILAHHGQREWGSPVAPKTRVAWLLHLSDGISARMNDCEKIDYLTLRKTT